MSYFRRVDGAQAGPNALGILVPGGARTLVILRPRALGFDLLPIRATLRNGLGSGFLDLERGEAVALAHAVGNALDDWAAGGSGCLGPIPAAGADGYWVQAEIGSFIFLACRRIAGEPYAAQVFVTLHDARALVTSLRPVLCPTSEAMQELYFNTREFAK